MIKKCGKCLTDKDISKFRISKNRKSSSSWCVECHKEYSKAHYLANKERHNEMSCENYISNKESISNRHKQYNIDNYETIREYEKEYHKLKRKKNSNYRIRSIISSKIYSKLKNSNSSKEESFIKYVPWSIKELKIHIESLFEPWMNWNNQGKYILNKWDDNDQSTWVWNLDHIIPHSKFNYSSMDCEEFKTCWSLENLRPYSAKQNLIDGNNR